MSTRLPLLSSGTSAEAARSVVRATSGVASPGRPSVTITRSLSMKVDLTPREARWPATRRVERRSPTEVMRSPARADAADEPSSAVAVASAVSSNCSPRQRSTYRSASSRCSWSSMMSCTTPWCTVHSSSLRRATASASPRRPAAAPSTSRFVTPYMADSTPTVPAPLSRCSLLRISATETIASAEPTEEPPNLWTFTRSRRPDRARRGGSAARAAETMRLDRFAAVRAMEVSIVTARACRVT
mmetsp:Transcript_11335/g.39496  ORF Transcript_11335/g.39496 Transcript_11335/m.39496 type:complete len:243 (+) Transcript_11335:991-1719(+)